MRWLWRYSEWALAPATTIRSGSGCIIRARAFKTQSRRAFVSFEQTGKVTKVYIWRLPYHRPHLWQWYTFTDTIRFMRTWYKKQERWSRLDSYFKTGSTRRAIHQSVAASDFFFSWVSCRSQSCWWSFSYLLLVDVYTGHLRLLYSTQQGAGKPTQPVFIYLGDMSVLHTNLTI